MNTVEEKITFNDALDLCFILEEFWRPGDPTWGYLGVTIHHLRGSCPRDGDQYEMWFDDGCGIPRSFRCSVCHTYLVVGPDTQA